MGRVVAHSLICFLVLASSCSAPLIAPQYNKVALTESNARVAIIGDTQRTALIEVWRERNNPQRRALLEQLARERPNALLHLGDMVFYGSYADDWRYFDEVMSPIRDAGIPVFPIYGNHEYFGSDEEMKSFVQERFPVLEEPWYSMVIDSVAYVMLNTNYRAFGMKVMSEQRKWFFQTMSMYDKADSVIFIVVLGHHPPFTNSTVVDDDNILQQYFLPAYMFSRKGAVWFSGHCHAYEHFFYGLKHFVVSGGGGGPRQRVLTDRYQQHIDMYDAGPVRPFHYCIVQREDSVLNVVMQPLETVTAIRGHSFSVALR